MAVVAMQLPSQKCRKFTPMGKLHHTSYYFYEIKGFLLLCVLSTLCGTQKIGYDFKTSKYVEEKNGSNLHQNSSCIIGIVTFLLKKLAQHHICQALSTNPGIGPY